MTVTFQIGRGGRFHNGGHKSLIGIDTPISNYFNDLFPHEKGDYPDDELGLYDGAGNKIMDYEEYIKANETGIGYLDIDGEYDTVYVKNAEDLDENEFKIILADSYGKRQIKEILTEFVGDTYSEEISKTAIRIADYFNDYENLIEWLFAYSKGCEKFLQEYDEYDEEPDIDDSDKFCKVGNKFYVKQ
jgi:hypothetical protein